MVEMQDLEVKVRTWRMVAVSQIPLLLVSIGFACIAIRGAASPAVVPGQIAGRGDPVLLEQVQKYKQHVEGTLLVLQEVMNKIAERSKSCSASPPKR